MKVVQNKCKNSAIWVGLDLNSISIIAMPKSIFHGPKSTLKLDHLMAHSTGTFTIR
jgi:hypothetical protein